MEAQTSPDEGRQYNYIADYDELERFQKSVRASLSHQIVVGARQVGKTQALIQAAVHHINSTNNIHFIVSSQRSRSKITNTLVSCTDLERTNEQPRTASCRNGDLYVYTNQDCRRRNSVPDPIDPDNQCVLVDEASYIDQETLMRLYEQFDGPMVWVGTPTGDNAVFQAVTNYSPSVTTHTVTYDDVSHIKSEQLSSYGQNIPDPSLATEFTSEYV